MEKIELGQKVTDSLTGFSGTVTAIATYLSGCVRAEVVSLDDPNKEYWFDIQRLGAITKDKPGGYHAPPPSIDP